LSDQSVDLVFTVTQISALDKVQEFTGSESTSWVAELEGPEEVGGLLEVGTDSEDLVDQILNTDDTIFAETGFNQRVVGKSNTLLVNLSITTLVDELADSLQVGVSVGDPWLDDLEHLEGSLGHANENTIVDLEKTEELEDLAGFWCDLVDTFDTDNEDQLILSRDVESTILFRETGETNLLTLLITVFLNVLLGTLEDDTTLLLVGLLSLLDLCKLLLSGLLLALALLQEGLGDQDLVGSWDGSMSRLVLSPAYI